MNSNLEFLLSLYTKKTVFEAQEIINKNTPLLLNSITSASPIEQQETIKTVNDLLEYIKHNLEIQVPFDDLIEILKSEVILRKNICAVFVKIGLQRLPLNDDVRVCNVLQKLMNIYSILPQSINKSVLLMYLNNCVKFEPIVFVNTLQKNQSYLITLGEEELKPMSEFVKNNYLLFIGNEKLFLFFSLKSDLEIPDFSKFNSLELLNGILSTFEKLKPEEKNRALYILSQIKNPFPILKILQNINLKYGYQCLEHQLILSPKETIQLFVRECSQTILTSINQFVYTKMNGKIMDTYLSCLKILLKKCNKSFEKDYALFKSLYKNQKILREDKISILYLFASFITPSDSLLNFLKNQVYDGDSTAMSLLRQIFPFEEPKTKVIACTLIGDPNFSDECRLMLNPYSFSINNGFRYTLLDTKAKAPSTTILFDTVISNMDFMNFFLRSSSTKSVSALFNFACLCIPTYPIPYDFIINLLKSCPNSGYEITQFLVYISNNLPREDGFNPNHFIDYIISESDPLIVESISKFLEWTKCDINIEEVSSKLKNDVKFAFLSHFTDQFDEAMKLLSIPNRSNLAKNCLMSMASRGILNESHFEKLYQVLSNDAFGIEILSKIASNNKELCERLVKKLFEPPFILSERIEVIVIAAEKLSNIVSEDFLMDLIDNGLKTDKSRRNSSIFLLYLINHKEPKRLWFTTRSLLFCCGAENGIVRNAGLIGLNILYTRSQRKQEIENAILGKAKPENETAQFLNGQSRAQFISSLLRISKNVSIFIQLLLPIIESEYLIFNGIQIPAPKIDGNIFAARFYYYSFSPVESTSKSYRILWKWATDGGKKLSISDIINSIDTEQDSWDIQKQNMNCIHDIISRISMEQAQEYFIKLVGILMKMLFSPAEEISLLSSNILDKLIQKCGKNINSELQHFILKLIHDLFETRQLHLLKLSVKWANEFIQIINNQEDSFLIFESLFNGLSTVYNISNMLTTEIWNAYTKSVFKCSDFNIKKFLQIVFNNMNKLIVLDSQRYGIYYAYDTIIRSPERASICDDIENMLPRIFTLINLEKNDTVLSMLFSIIQHSISCYYYTNNEIYDYDQLIIDLYFQSQKPEAAGPILKLISNINCLHSSISPFILFASCSENNTKEYNILIRDEIPMEIEINSNPNRFINFCLKYGIESEKTTFRSIGCKALLKIVSKMKISTIQEVKTYLFNNIINQLEGRLYPFKENLIDILTLLIPNLNELSSDNIDLIQKQCIRQKSIYRASAFLCIIEINKKYQISKDSLVKSMIDALQNGTLVAQKAAFKCSYIIKDLPSFSEFIQVCYDKLNTIEFNDFDEYCSLLLSLPNHKIPNFNKENLIKYATMKNPLPNITNLFNLIK